MTKRMLIDATHAEETRVVVLDGSRLEDFDVETATKKQLKGNIYLAKVVRVEPSLQAAFVEYGGNRHGFLAFGEIHPDYYQIPVADRQRLLELQEQEAREEEEAERRADAEFDAAPGQMPPTAPLAAEDAADAEPGDAQPDDAQADDAKPGERAPEDAGHAFAAGTAALDIPQLQPLIGPSDAAAGEPETAAGTADEAAVDLGAEEDGGEASPPPETMGGEADMAEEAQERRLPIRFARNYKIQEVIKRRQILLVQVVKEERGSKGAALTTYISMAGRFSVLMPNSPRGGGISRKITSAADRRRLKEVTTELQLPRGMGLIVRTAGANRPKPEIRRDCEYLLRLWDDIRDRTMQSVAPALIHEEASLIKRAIRDVYSRDVEEVLVDGEDGWRAARDFMRMLMPAHARKVQLWNEGGQPLFARQQVEAQLDAMLSPTVQLKSGGYLVINQTEALVAIDVNSGRSTRERGIEETAFATNMEAADEVARQLRLRDLAGLIVIDFIDMEAKKHNAAVERRIKEALKNDRARIQVGHISHFGLLEMSRQRLRPSLAETSFIICPHCAGIGHVRSVENAAMHVLRAIEEEGAKQKAAEILVSLHSSIALYIFNHKRAWLAEIEQRHMMRVGFATDESLLPPQLRIDRVRAQLPPEELPPRPVRAIAAPLVEPEPEFEEEAPDEFSDEPAPAAPVAAAPRRPEPAPQPAAMTGTADENAERTRRRRRRRRRGGRREDAPAGGLLGAAQGLGDAQSLGDASPDDAGPDEMGEDDTGQDDMGQPNMARHEGVAFAADAVPEDAPALPEPVTEATGTAGAEAAATEAGGAGVPPETVAEPQAEAKPRARRPRRPRRVHGDAPADATAEISGDAPPAPAAPVAAPAYTGPTPADPYGGASFDIFDLIEQQEAQRAAAPAPANVPTPEPQPQADIAPGIQPVPVGDAPAAEKKRGWWRR